MCIVFFQLLAVWLPTHMLRSLYEFAQVLDVQVFLIDLWVATLPVATMPFVEAAFVLVKTFVLLAESKPFASLTASAVFCLDGKFFCFYLDVRSCYGCILFNQRQHLQNMHVYVLVIGSSPREFLTSVLICKRR